MASDLAAAARAWLEVEPRAHEMTLRQIAILCWLCDVPGRHRHRTIRKELGVNGGVVTRAMTSLIRMGLAERIDDPGDGRDCFYEATDLGDDTRRRMREIAHG